jgi:hypothetical protein
VIGAMHHSTAIRTDYRCETRRRAQTHAVMSSQARPISSVIPATIPSLLARRSDRAQLGMLEALLPRTRT